MRFAMSLVVLMALGSIATAQIDRRPQLQPQPEPRQQVSADQRYCLMDREAGSLNCGFATLAECLATANVGREGDCGVNPRLGTTGSGFRDDQD